MDRYQSDVEMKRNEPQQRDGEASRYAAIMDNRMRSCIKAANEAKRDVPQKLYALKFVLTMPNMLRILKRWANKIYMRQIQLAMDKWKRSARCRKLQRHHSVKKIQVSWREAVARKSDKARLAKEAEERLRARNRAATIMQINIMKRLYNLKLHYRGVRKRNLKAVVIQRVFRGFVVRCQRIDDVRKILVQVLRNWAQGCTDKLLTNPYLRDLQGKHLVTTAIALSITPSHPYRNLPSMATLKAAIERIRIKRAELDAIFTGEKEQHRLILEERHLMTLEEHRSILFDRYLRGCEKRRRMQEMEEKLKLQREKLEYVKRIKRRAQQLKELGAEAMAVLEKKEREKMFREDYTIKRYYDMLKALTQKEHEANWECMKYEDALAHQRRAQDHQDNAWIAEMNGQVVRTVAATTAADATSTDPYLKATMMELMQAHTATESNNDKRGGSSSSSAKGFTKSQAGTLSGSDSDSSFNSRKSLKLKKLSPSRKYASFATSKRLNNNNESSSEDESTKSIVRVSAKSGKATAAASPSKSSSDKKAVKGSPSKPATMIYQEEIDASTVPLNNATANKWRDAALRKHFKLWDSNIDFAKLRSLHSKSVRFARSTNVDNPARGMLLTLKSQSYSPYLDTLTMLHKLRDAHRVREECVAGLVYDSHLFVVKLKKLCAIRHDLRVNKIHTRLQRQQLLKIAAQLEESLTGLEKQMEERIAQIPALCRQEVELSVTLFVPIGNHSSGAPAVDPTVYIHQHELCSYDVDNVIQLEVDELSGGAVSKSVSGSKSNSPVNVPLLKSISPATLPLGSNVSNSSSAVDHKHLPNFHQVVAVGAAASRMKHAHPTPVHAASATTTGAFSMAAMGSAAAVAVAVNKKAGHLASHHSHSTQSHLHQSQHQSLHHQSLASTIRKHNHGGTTKAAASHQGGMTSMASVVTAAAHAKPEYFWQTLKETLSHVDTGLLCPAVPPTYQGLNGHKGATTTISKPHDVAATGVPAPGHVTSSPKQATLKKQKSKAPHYMMSKSKANLTESRSKLSLATDDASSDSDGSPSGNKHQHHLNSPLAKQNSTIPGLHLFTFPDPQSYECILKAQRLHGWVKSTCDWMNDVESIWKEQHRIQTVSSLQRLFWMLTEACKHILANKKGSHNQQQQEQQRYVEVALRCAQDNNNTEGLLLSVFEKRMDAKDCLELLLCRSDRILSILSPSDSSMDFSVLLSSHLVDKHLGVHPFSVHGLLEVLIHLRFTLNLPTEHSNPSILLDSAASTNKKRQQEWPLIRVVRHLAIVLEKFFPNDKQQRKKSKERVGFEKLKSTKHFRSLSKYTPQALLSIESPQKRIEIPSLMQLLQALLGMEQKVWVQVVDSLLLDKKLLDGGSGVLTRLHSLQPSHFVSVVADFENWKFLVPVWSMPVYRWGTVAPPEPFWRRLHHEQRLGVVGKYTLIDRQDNRIDKIAQKMSESLWTKMLIRRALVRKVAETNINNFESSCMLWEDALAIRVRQLERARKQDEENRARFGRLGILGKLFGQCRVSMNARIGTFVIAPKSEDWHIAVLFNNHGKFNAAKPWKGKPVTNPDKILGQPESTVAPRVFQIRGIAELDASMVITNELAELQACVSQAQQRIRKRRRMCSWVTGDPVYFDASGKHRGAREASNDDDTFALSCEETWCFGGLHTISLAARVVEDININPRGYLRCSNMEGPVMDADKLKEAFEKINRKHHVESPRMISEPVIKASPSLGNLFAPIPISTGGSGAVSGKSTARGAVGVDTARTLTSASADTEDDLLSRGQYTSRENNNEMFNPLHARTGFTSCRILCEDDTHRGEFATHETSRVGAGNPVATKANKNKVRGRNRYLSASAIKRLRVECPLRELKTVSEFREHVWDAQLMDRYTGDIVVAAVVRIQCLFRAVATKLRVRAIRKRKYGRGK